MIKPGGKDGYRWEAGWLLDFGRRKRRKWGKRIWAGRRLQRRGV
jgi:hypothetical protein